MRSKPELDGDFQAKFDLSLYHDRLLDWYDQHGRELPWRSFQPKRPNSYHVLLSEFMLQQTQVMTVIDYFHRFTIKWPDLTALYHAPFEGVMAEWAGLGYYARARNLLKAVALIHDQHQGNIPSEFEVLKTLPGIGDYTAAAIAAIAFDKPVAVLDGNIERILMRLSASTQILETVKSALRVFAQHLTPSHRSGDYAQALMDLGATICKPKQPQCSLCPIAAFCGAYQQGIAEQLPFRKPKRVRKTRFGTAFLYVKHQQDGLYLYLEPRPETGLLGGTLGLPTTEWLEYQPNHTKTNHKDGTEAGSIRHIFTHFTLELALSIMKGKPPAASVGQYYAVNALDQLALSSLMRKAIKEGISHLSDPLKSSATR